MNGGIGILKSMTMGWWQLNKTERMTTLAQNYFGGLTQVLGDFFSRKVELPKMSDLNTIGLHQHIKFPDQLLDNATVDKALNQLSISRRQNAVRKLNKLRERFPSIPIRMVQRIRRVRKLKGDVFIGDFFKIIRSCCLSSNKYIRYFGVSWYALFLCGQRIISDWKSLSEGLIRAFDSSETSFTMMINKTMREVRCHLNTEVLKLMKLVDWHGIPPWMLDLLKRTMPIFGFAQYAVKRIIGNYHAMIDLSRAQ